MKVKLLLAAILPVAMFAQEVKMDSISSGATTFSSGATQVEKFDNNARKFNDWSISVGGGGAFMHSADLTSFYDKKVNFGYNVYVSLDKQISHTFGLSLLYMKGETKQKGKLPGALGVAAGVANAKTKYDQLSVIGDINFSNLLRRVDNHSNYRWALHGYGGVGLLGYKTELTDNAYAGKYPGLFQINQDLGISSIFFEAGTGLKYKISRRIDIEGRVMYIFSGDEEFDGGGWDRSYYPGYNLIHDSYSDNMFTATLGLTFKLGKNISHLTWHDPLQDAYARVNDLENKTTDLVVCKSGDNDNDGVCDDWDRQLDTPAGARVDGSGVALDMDLDGVIDLYDKCVTVPGPVENNGCPVVAQPVVNNSFTEIDKDFDGIEFELNSDKIRTKSYDKLNHAADIIKTLDNTQNYLVIGATDTRGSEKLNKDLSQRRADAVVKYLTGKGVNASLLSAEGHGKSDLKYPECDPATKCPEWKNEANRRVYFKQK